MNISTSRYTQDLRRYYRLPAVQSSLTVVLSLFVIAFFITFALRPTILAIVSLRANIVESKKTLQILDTKVGNLQKASTQLDAIKPSLEMLNTDIPNLGAAYNPLAIDTETIALQSGVVLDSESVGATLLFSKILSPFTPNKNQVVVELPYSIRVIGNYANVYTFLTKLLSLQRIIQVDNVSIAREVSAKNAAGQVSLNVSGNAYYLADEALLKAAINAKKGGK